MMELAVEKKRLDSWKENKQIKSQQNTYQKPSLRK